MGSRESYMSTSSLVASLDVVAECLWVVGRRMPSFDLYFVHSIHSL